ncbi:MAG TPA: hypothetical protein VHX60_00290 [Acidobacteriaceae bacterium]|jgi:hypothetical protein|nr:hypothetical protein [Acidobacteriaceae bacterium]
MKIIRRSLLSCSLVFAVSLSAYAQQPRGPVVLHAQEAAKLLPDAVFFAGQSANTQIRNAAGVRFSNGEYALAVLVDTSGYSTAVQQKYQGYLLTESALEFEGHLLVPGAYGFGFVDGEFHVMDIGNHDLLQAPAHHDAGLARPRPLQILNGDSPGSWRLCSGRECVGFHHAH